MKTKNDRRVVITGVGPVTSIGVGKTEFWENLKKTRMNIHSIPDRFEENYNFHSKYYVPFPHLEITDYGIPNKYNSFMEETSKLAIIGARLAFEDAGFSFDDQQLPRPSVFNNTLVLLGIGICSLKAGFQAFASHAFANQKELLNSQQLNTRYNRMVIPSIMPNSAASWISILFGIKGSNYTINASCASGTYAIGEAYRNIKNGLTDLAITGGIECLKDDSGTIMRGFDSLGTLTKSEEGRPSPFSNDRSGFLFSEGGGSILILEELETAVERGADIYAEIIGYESCSDAHSLVQIDESGTQIINMLKKLIQDRKIDYFNTHGTATVQNDEVERKVIKELFGSKPQQPFINSTKSIIGHSIGASGAIEALVTVLSIKNSLIHKNVADNTFPDLNLAYENINTGINLAVSTSYGFGGHNGALLFQKYKPQ